MTKYRIAPYNEVTHKGLVRHVLIRIGAKTKQIMVCVIINGKNLPNKKNWLKSYVNLKECIAFLLTLILRKAM